MAKLNSKEIRDLWGKTEEEFEDSLEEIHRSRKEPKKDQGGKISSKESKIQRDLMRSQEEEDFYSGTRGRGKKPR